jgi:hypothetical protein
MLPFHGTALEVRIGVGRRTFHLIEAGYAIPTVLVIADPDDVGHARAKLAVHLDRGQLRITYGAAAMPAVRLFEVPLGLDVIVRIERQVGIALVTAHALDDHVERDRPASCYCQLTLSRRLVGHAVCPHAIFS